MVSDTLSDATARLNWPKLKAGIKSRLAAFPFQLHRNVKYRYDQRKAGENKKHPGHHICKIGSVHHAAPTFDGVIFQKRQHPELKQYTKNTRTYRTDKHQVRRFQVSCHLVNEIFGEGGSTNESIPIIALLRLVTEVGDEAPHVRHAHAKRGARLAHHVFLNHDAAQIVRTVLERDLPDFLPLRDP